MEQFTLIGLDNLLVENGYIRSLEGQSDRLVYDKCNWIISAIARKNYAIESDFGEYANIHSFTLKRVLGRNYKKTFIKALVDLGVIIVNNKYSQDRFSKSYCFTKYGLDLGLVRAEVLSNRFRVSYEQFLSERFDEIYSNPLFRKLYDNLARLRLYETFIYYVEKIINEERTNHFRIKRYDSYYKVFKPLGEEVSPKEIFLSSVSFDPTVSKYGRVYYLGSSIPKLIRESLRIDTGELLYEVDMASAQFSLLLMKWMEINLANTDKDYNLEKEWTVYHELVVGGRIYDYIVSNSEACAGLPYREMKEELLSALNAKYYPSPINKELKRLFPSFMNWLNQYKRENGHESISRLGQSLESKIFVSAYMALPSKVFCLLVHDCILTSEVYANLVKDALIKQVMEVFPGIINPSKPLGLFKIDKVSLSDEETDKFRSEQYGREYYDDLLQFEF